ncbi:hypothetical protein HYT57_00375 [Candidatus Woesearchaeota archaeon]|nr:hypothetical protein [Candidatus Woesearchaeota archaeon]
MVSTKIKSINGFVFVVLLVSLLSQAGYSQEVIENANGEPVPVDGPDYEYVPEDILLKEGSKTNLINESGSPKLVPVWIFGITSPNLWKVVLVVLVVIIVFIVTRKLFGRTKPNDRNRMKRNLETRNG